jgi:hypothetical protein
MITPTRDRTATVGESPSPAWSAPLGDARIVPIHTVGASRGTVRDASTNRAESTLDQIHCPTSIARAGGSSQATIATSTATARFRPMSRAAVFAGNHGRE